MKHLYEKRRRLDDGLSTPHSNQEHREHSFRDDSQSRNVHYQPSRMQNVAPQVEYYQMEIRRILEQIHNEEPRMYIRVIDLVQKIRSEETSIPDQHVALIKLLFSVLNELQGGPASEAKTITKMKEDTSPTHPSKLNQIAYFEDKFGPEFIVQLKKRQKNNPAFEFLFDVKDYEKAKHQMKNSRQFHNGIIYGAIPNKIYDTYKSAGVLLYCVKDSSTTSGESNASAMSNSQSESSVHFLLGREDRSKKKFGTSEVWLHFGGKIDKVDRRNPMNTALRELQEETCGVLEHYQKMIKSQMESAECTKFWERTGYLLFLIEIPYDETLSSKFEEVKAEKGLDVNCDQDEIAWVPSTLILDAIERNDQFDYNGKKRTLYNFFCKLLREESAMTYLRALSQVK